MKGRGGVKDPGAVQVDRHAPAPGSLLHLFLPFEGHNRSPAAVMAVFQGYQTGPCQVPDVRLDGFCHLFRGREAIISRKNTRQDTGQGRHGCHLVVEDVAVSITDHFLAGVDQPHNRGKDRLGSPVGDDNFRGRIDLHPVKISHLLGNGLAGAGVPDAGCVLVDPAVDSPVSGLPDEVGAVEVGEPLTQINGLVLVGRTIYVVGGPGVTKIRLAPGLTNGRILDVLPVPGAITPTTADARGSRLYVVDAKFPSLGDPTTPFQVTSIPR